MAEYPMRPLSEVLVPATRFEAPVAGVRVRQLGVRLWGEGAYEREQIDGSETKYVQLNRVETGDFVVNKIWARSGSVAVVQAELEGAYVSSEFPLYTIRLERAEVQWLRWMTRTPEFWAKCDEASRGTSGKNRIKPAQFLGIHVPLPDVEEQRRVVARIEAVATRVAAVRTLRAANDADASALLRSLFRTSQFTPTPMHELVRQKRTSVPVDPASTYSFAGVYSHGRGVFESRTIMGNETAYASLTQVHAGDFMYPKLMAWEGALGVVPSACDGLYVSPEFPVFEVNQDRVLPEVLDVYFKTPEVWAQIAILSPGTNLRRRRLNPSAFLGYSFPLPPRKVQEQIRSAVDQVEDARRLAATSAADLDALLASTLDAAFSGHF